jgi:hypothetical protein
MIKKLSEHTLDIPLRTQVATCLFSLDSLSSPTVLIGARCFCIHGTVLTCAWWMGRCWTLSATITARTSDIARQQTSLNAQVVTWIQLGYSYTPWPTAIEECHLLGYKNPVHTSQETHYLSATESNQLMLCKIWGFHGGDYEECRLLGCDAV